MDKNTISKQALMIFDQYYTFKNLTVESPLPKDVYLEKCLREGLIAEISREFNRPNEILKEMEFIDVYEDIEKFRNIFTKGDPSLSMAYQPRIFIQRILFNCINEDQAFYCYKTSLQNSVSYELVRLTNFNGNMLSMVNKFLDQNSDKDATGLILSGYARALHISGDFDIESILNKENINEDGLAKILYEIINRLFNDSTDQLDYDFDEFKDRLLMIYIMMEHEDNKKSSGKVL